MFFETCTSIPLTLHVGRGLSSYKENEAECSSCASTSLHSASFSLQFSLFYAQKSTRRDSNPRPSPWQGDAPPLSHSCISFFRIYSVLTVPSKPHIEYHLHRFHQSTSTFWISPRPISNSQLHALLHFHLCPIYLVVFKGSYFFRMGYLILRGASRLDAFSVYPVQTWLPGRELSSSTGTPAVRPPRSSRTKGSSSQISSAYAG